jgi:hypothetical protein
MYVSSLKRNFQCNCLHAETLQRRIYTDSNWLPAASRDGNREPWASEHVLFAAHAFASMQDEKHRLSDERWREWMGLSMGA